MIKRKLSVALSVFLATGLLSPGLTVAAAPSINPYGTVEAELEFERNVKEVFTDEDAGATVVSLGSGNYFTVKSVNFSQGVSKIVIKAKADSAGLIVIHKDGEKGDVVGSIKLSGTDGEYREFSTSVKDLDGADTIAFVQTMGTSLVDSWTAEPGETPDEPENPDQPENPNQPEVPEQPENADQPEVPEQPENPDQPEVPEQPENPDQPENPTAVNPYEKVEAETAATLENAKLVPNKQSVLINDGGYIVAKNVDLSKGVSGFKVLAKTSAPKVKLDVYVDGTDTQLGSISVGTDMSSESFVKISSDLKGSHDVYFKANGGAVQIDAWQALEGQGGTEEPPVVEPPVGDTVNPYSKVEAEAATELAEAMVSPNKQSVVVKDGGYVITKNVDFSKGLSGFAVLAKASAPKVKLNIYIDGAKSPMASINVGTDIAKESTVDVTSELKGTHDVYIQADGGAITLDAWRAVEASGGTEEPPVVEPPVGDTVNPYEKVEAEASAELKSAMVTPNKQAVSIQKGGYAVAKSVDFSKGIKEFTVNAKASGANRLEARLDKADGDLIANFRVSTDAKDITVNAAKNITGTHDIYFVATMDGSLTFDSWKVTPSDGTEEPPVVEPPVGDTVDPYEKVEAEASAEFSNAMITPNKQAVSIQKGGFAVAKNVDFSKGVKEILVKAGASGANRLEVRLDKPTGERIASYMVSTDAKELTANVSASVTGTHDVYFVAMMDGTATFDYWKATPSDGTIVEPPVGDTVDPYEKVEAEKADELSSAMIAPSKTSVVVNDGGYIVVKNVNFAKGLNGFQIYAQSSKPGVKLNVYIDKSGYDAKTAIGTANVGANMASGTGIKLTSDLTGTHDVYFEATGGSVTFDAWNAMAKSGTIVEPPVGDTVDPYEKVEAEKADELSSAMIAPSKTSVVVNDGGYIVVKNVNFAKGLNGFQIYAQSSKPGVKLNVYIDKSGYDAKTAIGTANVGANMASGTGIKLTSDLTGTHDVYFEATGGSVTFDAWNAMAKSGTIVEPPVGDTVDPYSTVEAEASAELKSAMVTPNKQAVSIQKGGYAVAKNVDFSKGIKEFTVNAKASGANRLEARLDKADGDLIANFRVSTDAKDITVTAAKNVTGTHDIYFVATMDGSITFDSWKVTPSDGTIVEPPVGDTINPYNKVEAEVSKDLTNAMLSPNKQSIVISDGGYILVQNIDFSKGISGFKVLASASQPKVKLNIYIDDSQTPIGSISVGTDITKETFVKVSTDITGKHYVYFEAKGGAATFDAWQAMPSSGTIVEPPVYEDINPYNTVEGETSTDLSNARLTPNKQGVSIGAGGYAVAKNVVFSDGISEFIVNAGATNSTRFEVRVGSASGDLIGYATVSGSTREFKITASKNITGKKDIYFVVPSGGSAVTLDSWKVNPYKEVVEPPVVETGMKLTQNTSKWQGGYQTNFTVTNSSGNTVNTWKLKIKRNGINITQSWCVNIQQQGDYYVITPMSWNSTLGNGQSTTFGIIGSGEPSQIDYVFE